MKTGRTADVIDVGWVVGAGLAARDEPSGHHASLRAVTHMFTAALDAVTAPLLAVHSDGGLLFGNRAAHALLRESRWLEIHRGRVVSSVDSDSSPPLAPAIARLDLGVGSTVLLTNRQNGEQAVATVAPLAFDHDPTVADSVGLGLLWLTSSELEQAAVGQLSRLFNLTPAEEQLLTQLVSGAGVREAAARHQISIHTARNQLKSIFHKTGRHSQAQLLTLVVRMASLQFPMSDPCVARLRTSEPTPGGAVTSRRDNSC